MFTPKFKKDVDYNMFTSLKDWWQMVGSNFEDLVGGIVGWSKEIDTTLSTKYDKSTNTLALKENTIYLATPLASSKQIETADYALKTPYDTNGKSVCDQIQAIIDANASDTKQTRLVFLGQLIVDIPCVAPYPVPKIIIKSGIVIEGDFKFIGNHIYNSGQHLFDFVSGAKNCGWRNLNLEETIADSLYDAAHMAGGTYGTGLSNVILENVTYTNLHNAFDPGHDDAILCFNLSGDGIKIKNFVSYVLPYNYTISHAGFKVSGTNQLIENCQFGELTVEVAASGGTISNCSINSTGSYNSFFSVSGTKNYLENIKIAGASSGGVTIASDNKCVGVTKTIGSVVTKYDSSIGADFVSITDTGNYFSSTTAEGALQELGLNKANKVLEAWTTPSLTNNWVAYDTARTPKYRKDNFGRVTLKGAIKSGQNGYYVMILPAGYRPLQTMYFVLHANSTIAYCTIDTSGYVTITSTDVTRISLDSISFYID